MSSSIRLPRIQNEKRPAKASKKAKAAAKAPPQQADVASLAMFRDGCVLVIRVIHVSKSMMITGSSC